MISPDRRREAVEQVMEVLGVSERRSYRVIGQPRVTQRYPKIVHYFLDLPYYVLTGINHDVHVFNQIFSSTSIVQ